MMMTTIWEDNNNFKRADFWDECTAVRRLHVLLECQDNTIGVRAGDEGWGWGLGWTKTRHSLLWLNRINVQVSGRDLYYIYNNFSFPLSKKCLSSVIHNHTGTHTGLYHCLDYGYSNMVRWRTFLLVTTDDNTCPVMCKRQPMFVGNPDKYGQNRRLVSVGWN